MRRRPRQVERFTHGGIANTDDFLGVSFVSEAVDDVALPIRGSITRIHRIERGLLVREFRMASAKPQKVLGRSIERNALRRKFTLDPLGEQRQDFIGRVVANGQRADAA